MRDRTRVLFAAAAVALLAASQVQAQVTLLDLTTTGGIDEIIVDDKRFYNFRNFTSTNPNFNAGLIIVSGIVDGGEQGLLFQSNVLDTRPNPQGVGVDATGTGFDVHFNFTVATVSGAPLIHDNTLKMTSTFGGLGGSDIIENAADQFGNDIVAKEVYETINGAVKTVHRVYQGTYAIVDIAKDITLFGDGGTVNYGRISDFTQTFSQVPTPAAVHAGALLLAGMLAARVRGKAR